MNRAELSWALSAVLPHAGKAGNTAYVGLEQCDGYFYTYATDKYTLGIARVESVVNGFANHLLTAKEASDLERYIRPGKVAERDMNVWYGTRPYEFHVGFEGDTAVFEACPGPSLNGYFDIIGSWSEKPTEWDSVTVQPSYLARFGKASRDNSPVLITPKRGNEKGGALLITVGADFIGLAQNISYSHTPVQDLESWPINTKDAA